MSSATPPPVVSMLAWWDPKDRKIVFNPDSIVPGVLFLGGNSISFVTPDTTVFECLLDERPPSLRGFFQALTCAFRITCDGITYRLYLYPPQGAPKLTKDHLEGIGATLHVTSYAGALRAGRLPSARAPPGPPPRPAAR